MKNGATKMKHLASVRTKENRIKTSIGAKAYWKSLTKKERKSFIEKRIDSYTKNLSEGKYTINSNRWKTGYYTSTITGKKEWYDSSLELSRMKHYDSLGIKWTKKHGIRIPYINSEGTNTYYVPDFYLEDLKTIEETKGWMQQDVILKAKIAIDYCKTKGLQYNFFLGMNFEKKEELCTIKK